MAVKNRCYVVRGFSEYWEEIHGVKEVLAGATVKALEGAPKGSLDVIDVQLANGEVKNVYSFQLDEMIKCPEKLKSRRK